MDIPLNLTCWYLNAHRIMELVGVDAVAPRLQQASALGDAGHLLRSRSRKMKISKISGMLQLFYGILVHKKSLFLQPFPCKS
ncbi:MAG: hypothetical protein HQL59_02820 [Magnetococcales bacterium]|nr:hypothetical protein [Magnetococcales bacterium]